MCNYVMVVKTMKCPNKLQGGISQTLLHERNSHLQCLIWQLLFLKAEREKQWSPFIIEVLWCLAAIFLMFMFHINHWPFNISHQLQCKVQTPYDVIKMFTHISTYSSSITTCHALNTFCASVILVRKPQGALQNHNVLIQLLAFYTCYFLWKGDTSFLPTIPFPHPAKP